MGLNSRAADCRRRLLKASSGWNRQSCVLYHIALSFKVRRGWIVCQVSGLQFSNISIPANSHVLSGQVVSLSLAQWFCQRQHWPPTSALLRTLQEFLRSGQCPHPFLDVGASEKLNGLGCPQISTRAKMRMCMRFLCRRFSLMRAGHKASNGKAMSLTTDENPSQARMMHHKRRRQMSR